MSSVIRVVNVGEDRVNFKIDPIFKGSSILSSRCVVEYDGIFVWPGTDRFYIYNGLVDELKNNLDQDYFFDNIDLAKRQLVFAVKYPKKGEIWWYYPERGNPATVGCTRAVVFNIRENTWYDTAITRDSGYYFGDTGDMFTFGLPQINPDGNSYIWRHEVGVSQNIPVIIAPAVAASNVPIPSSVTTPYFSWAAFNPMKQATGVDKWVELQRVEPDFIMNNDGSRVNMIINSKEFAQSPLVSSAPIPIARTTPRIDTNIQGRHMSFTFNSTDYFEMGHVYLLLSTGDGQ
jgi:hypothetical protein